MKINPDQRQLTLIALLAALLLLSLPALAQADLPIRPTPTATPKAKDSKDRDHRPVGASIILNTGPELAGRWSVVQWQDSAGAWHDVEGWRGTVGVSGSRSWWVAQKDFGSGPFRWTVMASPNGPFLGSSAPFTLPAEANEQLHLVIDLP